MATRLSNAYLDSYKSGSWSGSETPAHGLDGSTGTKLCNTNFSSIAPWWFILDAGAVYYLQAVYNVYSGNDAPNRDPRNWLIQGSYDKSTWYTIDTVTNNPTWGGRQQLRQFTNDNVTVPYRYYRVYIQSTNGDSIMQFSEWQLFRTNIARTITVSAGSGGSVSPGTGYVENGTSKTWTITPDEGKVIDTITYGGASQTVTDETGMDFTDASVDADATLAVTFKDAIVPTNNHLSLPRRSRYPGSVSYPNT